MLTVIPLRPDQELLIEALRTPAPRPVQYVRWVRVTRFLLLNTWVAGTVLAHWFIEPAYRENVTLFSIIIAAVLLYVELFFRCRSYLLSKGEVNEGVVVKRDVIQYNNHYWKSKSYQICYRFSSHDNKMRQHTVVVSKRIYDACPLGSAITILSDSRFRWGSLPLFMIEEVTLV